MKSAISKFLFFCSHPTYNSKLEPCAKIIYDDKCGHFVDTTTRTEAIDDSHTEKLN